METDDNNTVKIEEDSDNEENNAVISNQIKPTLDLATSTVLLVEATVIENPAGKQFLRSFESTSNKRKYQNKFNTVFERIKQKAYDLSPEEFYDYFVSQHFVIQQGDKQIRLCGKTDQWKYMLYVWLVANDNELMQKYKLTPPEDKSTVNPYQGLPFTRKQLKKMINNLDKIPKNQLMDIRKQMLKLPEDAMPDDTAREFYQKIRDLKT